MDFQNKFYTNFILLKTFSDFFSNYLLFNNKNSSIILNNIKFYSIYFCSKIISLKNRQSIALFFSSDANGLCQKHCVRAADK